MMINFSSYNFYRLSRSLWDLWYDAKWVREWNHVHIYCLHRVLLLKWVFNIFCTLLVSTVVRWRQWWHFQQYTVMTFLCLFYLVLCHCLHTFLISALLNIVWCSKILRGEWSFLLSLSAELITGLPWNEGNAIPQNHSSSDIVSYPKRLESFSNTTNITHLLHFLTLYDQASLHQWDGRTF